MWWTIVLHISWSTVNLWGLAQWYHMDHWYETWQQRIWMNVLFVKRVNMMDGLKWPNVLLDSELGHYWLRQWFAPYSLPSHYLSLLSVGLEGTNCSVIWYMMMMMSLPTKYILIISFTKIPIICPRDPFVEYCTIKYQKYQHFLRFRIMEGCLLYS